MNDETASVLQFAKTCPACVDGLHDRCHGHLGELFGYDHVPCPCGCWDERGLTDVALHDMMRRHPDVLARRLRADEGSLAIHWRGDHSVRVTPESF